MLKISSKQQKMRQNLLNKNYQSFVQQNLKLFFVTNFSASLYKYNMNLFILYKPKPSFTKMQTICFLTGRSRSVYRTFKMSRLQIRSYAGFGYFVGLSKSN